MTGLSLLLGLKTGSKVSIINPPPGFVQRLNPLPDGVEFLVTSVSGLDVILFFTSSAHELVERLPALSRAMVLTGSIWICFPEAAKRPLSEDFVRHAALDLGMVDDKRAALGEGWQGLRLVWRQRGRPEKPTDRDKKVRPTALA